MGDKYDKRVSIIASHVVGSKSTDYDVIIIGGGVHGASTADFLTKSGSKKVLLLEQFGIDHEEGSSHGDGRIIRFAYPEPFYLDMAKIAYRLWTDVEKRSGTQLIKYVGGVDFGRHDHRTLQELIQNFEKNKIPYEVFDAKSANQRFPMYHFEDGMKVIYQKDGGVVFAGKAVRTLCELAKKNGATVLHNEKAISIKVESETRVVVTTESGKVFSGKQLVITAGGWAKKILSDLQLSLPLVTTQEQLFYYEPKKGGAVTLPQLMSSMPTFIYHGEKDFYGLPPIEIPGVKVGWHHSGPEFDVNTGKLQVDNSNEEVVRPFMSKTFPCLDLGQPIKKVFCVYTSTPDHHFIIDHHPQHKNVIIGSACSGHGFKFGPAIGSLLTSFVLNEKPEMSLQPFSISRFSKPVVKRTGI